MAVNAVGDYTVAPAKENDHRDAISGLDAAYILQYVVGTRSLNARQIAMADVSQADDVTAYDAALIARHLVGLTDPPSQTGRWIFSPTSRVYQALQVSVEDAHFEADLYGDVTGDWGDGTLQVQSRLGTAESSLRLTDMEAVSGATVDYPVEIGLAQDAELLAYQLDILYDASVLKVISDNGAVRPASGWQLVYNEVAPGQLKIVAYRAAPLDTAGPLFELRFRVKGDAGEEAVIEIESLRFNESAIHKPEAHSGRIVIIEEQEDEEIPNWIYLPNLTR